MTGPTRLSADLGERSVRVPGYRLHKPSGRAVVTLNGKDYYLGGYGSKESKAAYDRKIAEYQATGQSTSYGIEANKTTVAMLVADYKEYDQICYALRHLENYHDLLVQQFAPLKLKAVQATLVKTVGAHGKPISRKYINVTIDRIRIMFRWAASNEIAEAKVYDALMTVDRLKAGRTSAPDLRPVKPVDDAIVAATVVHCTKVVTDMIMVQRLTGMRPAEVCFNSGHDRQIEGYVECRIWIPQDGAPGERTPGPDWPPGASRTTSLPSSSLRPAVLQPG